MAIKIQFAFAKEETQSDYVYQVSSELKRCSVLALLMAPIVLQLSLVNFCQILNLNEMCRKEADKDGEMDFIRGIKHNGTIGT